MKLIEKVVSKPIPVAAMVILIVFFGILGLTRLPVQLTPDVELPQITVTTTWPGASPQEIERDIIEKQEDKLKDIAGLQMMESSSYNNYGEVNLTFVLETEISRALLDVSNKMNEVEAYPENVEEPEIDTTGAHSDPILWLMLKKKGTASKGVREYQTFFDNQIKQQLERVKGVSSLIIAGGTKKQLHIVLDLEKMARHNISIADVKQKITAANQNRSAGVLGIARKDYRLRIVSQFQTPDDPMDVVVCDDGVNHVYLRDIAHSEMGYEKESVSVMQNASDAIVVGILKEHGANVLHLLGDMRVVVDRLNNGILSQNGLYLDWGYDQSSYINKALSIVKNNFVIGGVLAMVVLLIFLRSFSATLTTVIAIPISVLGTFLALWVFHRNLNVVSLAGISFAVGMLVDNSIVVLENIDRHKKMGKTGLQASCDGTREVFGAVVASTLTTVAVFLPIIFIQGEAGQLFRDIAIAITASILFSLFVSIGVIPVITNYLFDFQHNHLATDHGNEQETGFILGLGRYLKGIIIRFSDLSLKNGFTRAITVAGFTCSAMVIVILLIPKAEYLPQGNQNYIVNLLIPPPGASVEKRKEIGEYIYRETADYFKEDHKDGVPQLKYLWYLATDKLNLFGAISTHNDQGREMMPLFRRIMQSIPDMFGVCVQVGIFQHRIGCSKAVDVNITGEEMDGIIDSGHMMYRAIMKAMPGAQIRPVPSLEATYPEVRITPDKRKLAASGMTEESFARYRDIMMDGCKIDDYAPDGKKEIDLILKGGDKDFTTPEALMDCQIVNSLGQLIRIKDVATLEYTNGLIQIDHMERNRTVKLEVSPPGKITLQEATQIIEKSIVAPMVAAGTLKNVAVTVTGNASRLTETRKALQWNFIIALIITYLLMAALFENLLYPFIIMFTIPLAGAGGFIGLKLVNMFIAPQGFDILTMLGFIILIGTVVNNAILIVDRSLTNVRQGKLSGIMAISEAVETRIRPIFMSAATSIFGLLPLVLSTGSGSELYRGIGSVLLGGLSVSTLFTLFVVPALLSFFIGFETIKAKGDDE
jgi:HAE1 family hydrophobic/amphiphilic exporter-1